MRTDPLSGRPVTNVSLFFQDTGVRNSAASRWSDVRLTSALRHIQCCPEFCYVLVAGFRFQFKPVGLDSHQSQLFFFGFECVLQISDLIFLQDDVSPAPGQLGLYRPQSILHALKLDKAMQYGAHC